MSGVDLNSISSFSFIFISMLVPISQRDIEGYVWPGRCQLIIDVNDQFNDLLRCDLMAMNLTSLVKIRQWDQLQFLNAPQPQSDFVILCDILQSTVTHYHLSKMHCCANSVVLERSFVRLFLQTFGAFLIFASHEVSRNRLQSLEPLGALRRLLHLNASHNLLIRSIETMFFENDSKHPVHTCFFLPEKREELPKWKRFTALQKPLHVTVL